MNKSLLYIVFYICVHFSFAQSKVPSKRLDRLANVFSENYPNDSVRAVKIYLWVNKKIKYDYRSFLKIKFPAYNSNPLKVLRRKKALCSGLSILYEDLCSRSKVSALKISGQSDGDHFPGTNYFYANHAWNMVKINDIWRVCDITSDNGYITPRKMILKKAFHKIFNIPIVYNRYKFVKTNSLNYWSIPPENTIKRVYPTLFKAQGLDTCISIKEFENEQCRTIDSPQKSPSFSCTPLEEFYQGDYQSKLLKEIYEVKKSNPRNHLTILENYYNYVRNNCSSKSKAIKDFSCTGNVFIDSALIYAGIFKRDNSTLNNQNKAFINNENAVLRSYLKKTRNDNNRLRTKNYGKYISNRLRYKTIAFRGDGITSSFIKKLKKKDRVIKSRNWSKPEYRNAQLGIYYKNLRSIDSLSKMVLSKRNDFASKTESYKKTSDSLINLVSYRYLLLKTSTDMDSYFYLSRIIIPSVMYKIDSLSKDKFILINQIRAYEGLEFRKFHGPSTVLIKNIFNMYLQNYHIQKGLENVDSIQVISEKLNVCVNLSSHLYGDRLSYHSNMSSYGIALYTEAKKESNTIVYAFRTRAAVHKSKMKKEKRRYTAYHHIAQRMTNNLNVWKKYKPSKTVARK